MAETKVSITVTVDGEDDALRMAVALFETFWNAHAAGGCDELTINGQSAFEEVKTVYLKRLRQKAAVE